MLLMISTSKAIVLVTLVMTNYNLLYYTIPYYNTIQWIPFGDRTLKLDRYRED